MLECAICGDTIDNSHGLDGHNPEPVIEGRCCEECNLKVVIPVRMKMVNGVDMILTEKEDE